MSATPGVRQHDAPGRTRREIVERPPRSSSEGAMSYLAVVTTVDSRERALAMAHALVQRKLAACVQLSAIESVYPWNGAITQDREVRVLCKTTTARYDDIVAVIKALHSYELPAVHAIALDHVEAAYADWITVNTAP
jgi:periplasmic divalent cation tolerance protein